MTNATVGLVRNEMHGSQQMQNGEGMAADQAIPVIDGIHDNLKPTRDRIMDNWSYLFAWLGGCVSIGTFSMGASLIGVLNLTQAVVAMAIGCSVIALGLVINGRAGHKYGIPFTIQARTSYGIYGTKLSGAIRAVPAVVWFGFQSWIGAGAINEVLRTFSGFDNIVVCFISFQLLQILLSLNGFKGIKWLENIGSVFIIFALMYMFYSVLNKYGAEVAASVTNIEGTWGLEFWGGTTAFLGIYSTMMLNASDYSRELKRETKSLMQGTLYWCGILPATLFMGLIGLMVSSGTGSADPIAVFSSAVDNKFLLVITLLFIAFAQVTTNVLNNVVPPVYVLMDAFKMKYRTAVVAVGLLAFGTFPWELVRPESAVGLSLFVQTYSAFLGPIFAVMVVDYYFVRKRRLDVQAIYDVDGPYKGVNLAGLIATAVGVIVAIIFVKVSWYASLLPAGLTYYLLMKVPAIAKDFRKGTVFEK